MFSGIVEQVGRVMAVAREGTNTHFDIEAEMAGELKVDQSVSHNGACLTVISHNNKSYRVTAVAETLAKTNLDQLRAGQHVNLERALTLNARLDGHLVQGHVDQTGVCESIAEKDGSWIFTFSYDASSGNLTVEKGSVCVNGVSLTVFDTTDNKFSVAIIPYTFEHTTFKDMTVGEVVNLEFDIIGKYVHAYLKKMK